MLDDNSVINSWSLSLAESVPLCSCPPQTSLNEVDGGIFLSVDSLTLDSLEDVL